MATKTQGLECVGKQKCTSPPVEGEKSAILKDQRKTSRTADCQKFIWPLIPKKDEQWVVA